MIAGALPAPVFTSRDRDWNDLIVERHSASDVNVVAEILDYRVRIHLGQPAELYQSRGGKHHVGRFTAGMVTVTPPGSPKAWGRKGHAEALVIRFPPAFLEQVAGESTDASLEHREIVDVFAAVDPDVAQIGYALLAEVEQKGFASHVRCQSLLMSLALRLMARYSSVPTELKSVKGTLALDKVRRTFEFIEENLDKPLTLQSITDEVALSPYHFARLFKRATGLAPHQYVMRRRLERAQEMLRCTRLSVAEIALAVGCANQSHFSALFRRTIGVTPLAYRRHD